MQNKRWRRSVKPKQKTLLRKVFCALAMLAGLYYLQTGLTLMKEKDIQRRIPSAEIEITIGEVSENFVAEEKMVSGLGVLPEVLAKKSDKNEEAASENPAMVTSSEPTDTAFLYHPEEVVTVVRAEEANADLLKQVLEQSHPRPASTSTNMKNPPFSETEIPTNNTSAIAPNVSLEDIENFNQDKLDRLYEEDLPDNIIDEQPQNRFIHINHTKVKNLNILPHRKPLYFGDKPVIAIVIDDMGVSQKRTADIIKLHAPLTASFLTYSSNLEGQIDNSRQAGHEIMIHVPMEAQKNTDAAPDVLTTKMTKEELQNNFRKMLAKFHNIKGINNHMGSKLTEDEPRMEAIMEVLKENNLFFLDSKTSAKSQAHKAARRQKVAYGHRHVFLDNNNDKAYILGQLALTERLARKNGYAVAIGHPKTQTYEALKEWLSELDKKQIRLMHLSEIMAILNPQISFRELK